MGSGQGEAPCRRGLGEASQTGRFGLPDNRAVHGWVGLQGSMDGV